MSRPNSNHMYHLQVFLLIYSIEKNDISELRE